MDAVAKKIEIREVSQRKTAYLFIKRVFDIVLSLVLIVVLLPLLLLVMAAIAIDSPGPVIFKQKRIGYQGKEFMIFKFRTLSITAPDNVATRKLENIDGCSTKLGRLLRRLSIDELPQLFNILRGDMSFVGFRPVCTSEKKLNALRRKMGVFEGRPPHGLCPGAGPGQHRRCTQGAAGCGVSEKTLPAAGPVVHSEVRHSGAVRKRGYVSFLRIVSVSLKN